MHNGDISNFTYIVSTLSLHIRRRLIRILGQARVFPSRQIPQSIPICASRAILRASFNGIDPNRSSFLSDYVFSPLETVLRYALFRLFRIFTRLIHSLAPTNSDRVCINLRNPKNIGFKLREKCGKRKIGDTPTAALGASTLAEDELWERAFWYLCPSFASLIWSHYHLIFRHQHASFILQVHSPVVDKYSMRYAQSLPQWEVAHPIVAVVPWTLPSSATMAFGIAEI
jgi:hypothetical protein